MVIENEIISMYEDAKKTNPNIDNDMVMMFFKNMPNEAKKAIHEVKYGKHLTNEEQLEEGLSYIRDINDKPIQAWTQSEVLKIANNYVDIDDEEFYEHDLVLQANIKKGDYGNLTSDAVMLIRMAISDLKDTDFPYYPPSERAYRWLEAHKHN